MFVAFGSDKLNIFSDNKHSKRTFVFKFPEYSVQKCLSAVSSAQTGGQDYKYLSWVYGVDRKI